MVYYCISTVIQERRNKMAWSFSAHRPVYYQIAERIKHSIITGAYAPGEQIPSVRQLALEAAVNPNTVQHAFSHLEDLGLIESRGTVGRFVTENSDIVEECRMTEAGSLVDDFIEKASMLRIGDDTILGMVSERLSNLTKQEVEDEHS